MSQIYKSIIISIIIFIIGVYVGYHLNNKNKVVVQKVVQYKTKYIKQPISCEDYKKCYKSPIKITAKEKKEDVIEITANDLCKEAKADIHIKQQGQTQKIIISAITGFFVGVLFVSFL